MWSYLIRSIPALSVGFLCLLMATPAVAHPGSLWGIDLSSVVALRDQARMIAHVDRAEAPEPGADEVLSEGLPGQLDHIQTIVIDPGHGGENSGATGIAGVAEKYLNLELAYQLREELQDTYPRLRVVMTRYWDATVSHQERVHMANLAGADLFISLHYNAAPHDRALGFETYFLQPEQVTPGQQPTSGQLLATTDPGISGLEAPISDLATFGVEGEMLRLIERDLLLAHQHDLSGYLAESIQQRFSEQIDSIDRGVKQANFAVLRGAHMPAALVEAGFLTHPEEGLEVFTPEHRSRVTQALVGAVESFDAQLGATLDAARRSDDDDEGEPAEDSASDEPTEAPEEQAQSEPVASLH